MQNNQTSKNKNHINKIAIFYGGDSSEREISLLTGQAVFEALTSCDNINPKLFDIPNDLDKFIKNKDNFDMVFIALHGSNGEDGSIQGMLDVLGVSYTGSGVLGCATSLDKSISKSILQDNNLPVIKGINLPNKISFENAKKLINKFGFPCILKPINEGSSIDVYALDSELNINNNINNNKFINNFEKKQWMLERRIIGREFAVGIINNKALPIVEIIPKSGVYDYKAKYISGDTQYVCPANLTDDISKKMQDMAVKAFNYLKCDSWGRVDFLMDDQGIYILEVNTVPGLTKSSLLPKAASKIGINFSELVLLILNNHNLKRDNYININKAVLEG